MLEIQINTDALHITQEVLEVECDVSLIKLTGCYSCVSGGTLFLQGQTKEGSTTATIECSSVGFFSPFHITSNLTTYQLIMKVDQSDINMDCTIRWSQSTIPVRVKGHLQYLQHTDNRREQYIVHTEPAFNPFSGFSLFSLYGSETTNLITHRVIICVCNIHGCYALNTEESNITDCNHNQT